MADGPKKIWDNIELVAEVQKSPSTKLRVELAAREGVKYLNIREWYIKKSEQVWKPGVAGIIVPLNFDKGLPAEELAQAILKAVKMAPTFELENDAKAVWSYK